MMTIKLFVVGALCCLAAIIDLSSAKFRVIREWNYVNFTWPDNDTYRRAMEQQLYVPQNNIIAGLKYFEGYYYITLPRMKGGVPATLTRIPSGTTNDTAPLLMPFPSWEMNDIDNCDALQNVQNVEIDPGTGQIWIIDGGRSETLTNLPVVKCKPKLLVYDLRKMENVLTYTFPEHVASFNGSFLYDIVLDNTEQGYAYITDNSGRDPGIIVFSMKDHQAWKIRHSQSMRADPHAAYFHVNGIVISALLNIASIALGPKIRDTNDRIVLSEDREVFYAPLSSLHLYSINTSVLRNEQFASNDGEYQGTVKDWGNKSSQSVGMLMDNKGVMYYSLLAVNSVARWDSSTAFASGQKIIARDERYLEWVNSFCFDDSGNLTLLVNKLNRFIYDKLDINQPNFRLIASHIGGKSYLFDENYNNYESDRSTVTSSTSTSTTTENAMSALKPGLDQDPYLAPQPKAEPEPQPTAEPEPEPEPSSTSSSSTAKSNISDATTTKKVASTSAASEKTAIGLISLITAAMLFVV